MGMYDTFIFKRRCPECDGKLGDWQTKQLMRMMDYYKIGDWVKGVPNPDCKVECHDFCKPCKKMFYAWAIVKDGRFVNHIIPPKGEEVSRVIEQ